MKKLMILVAVLMMATVANAGLILTIGGEVAPDAITLNTSDWIELDIDVLTGNITGGQLDVQLSNNQASLDSAGVAFPANASFMFPWYVLAQGPQHLEITGGNFSPVNGPLTIMNGLMLHCDEPTDLVVNLVVTGDTTIDGLVVANGTILDSIAITQIPEPATIALLSLGGLLLRRRK